MEAMRLLLNAGADPNHCDWEETTLLQGASANGHDVFAQLLLKQCSILCIEDWPVLFFIRFFLELCGLLEAIFDFFLAKIM